MFRSFRTAISNKRFAKTCREACWLHSLQPLIITSRGSAYFMQKLTVNPTTGFDNIIDSGRMMALSQAHTLRRADPQMHKNCR